MNKFSDYEYSQKEIQCALQLCRPGICSELFQPAFTFMLLGDAPVLVLPQPTKLPLGLYTFHPAWLAAYEIFPPGPNSVPTQYRLASLSWVTEYITFYQFPWAWSLRIGLDLPIFSPFTCKSVTKSLSFNIGLFQTCIFSFIKHGYFPNWSLPFPHRKFSTLPECSYFWNANLIIIVLLNF